MLQGHSLDRSNPGWVPAPMPRPEVIGRPENPDDDYVIEGYRGIRLSFTDRDCMRMKVDMLTMWEDPAYEHWSYDEWR
ncbi:MAG: hypothetical protein OIF34_12245, partial [Porticoccaceae bacterium]|nr:hypothetical protein [Porticoccaceae bacterium]